MCSINDENVRNETMVSAPKLSFKNAKCRRCEEVNAHVLLRKVDPYCRECFMTYAVHKFRSTIGKARALQHNECILLAYSGGLSSGCMVELVKQGLQSTDSLKMKMIFKPTLLHIDESCLLNLTIEERKANIDFILDYAKKCCFDVYICGLEYSLASDSSQLQVHFNCYQTDTSNYGKQLVELFLSVQSLTAKEDLFIRLKQRLITLLAKRLNQTKVFLGPNATRLAGQLLTAVGQGRGAQIAQEIGFSDSRTGTDTRIVLLRPMREFVDKEVAYLAHFLNVDSLCIPTLSSKSSPTASIGRMTEDFIVTLQANFPATISTLFRIGDKLKSNANVVGDSSPSVNDSLCLLCLSTIEQSSPCSASEARSISQTISRSRPGSLKDNFSSLNEIPQQQVATACNSNCGSQVKSCCKSTSDIQPINDWSAILCYGCRITMEEVKKPELMPIHFQEESKLRSRRQVMRQTVEQFLL